MFFLPFLPFAAEAKAANFDECILENISSTSTEAAVAAVTRACKNLFPEKPNKSTQKPIFQPSYKIITLRKNDSDWITNAYNRSIFRVNVTNLSKYTVNGFKDYTNWIWLNFRVVGCGDRVATRAEMKQIQNALNQRNYKVGAADGRLGPKTITAIKKFKKDYGITYPNADISKNLVEKLRVSVARYDKTRAMTAAGTIPHNVIYSGQSSYVDFDIDKFLPDNECFLNEVKAKVQTN